jgi:hypothetical protein
MNKISNQYAERIEDKKYIPEIKKINEIKTNI